MTTHAEWLEQSHKIKLSNFGVKVANIIGIVWQGIYHLQTSNYINKRTDWNNEKYIELIVTNGLSTWDRNDLTELVVLCHDARIRLEIQPCSPRHLKLTFHQRVPIEEASDMPICRGHPTIEEQIKRIRQYS